MILFGPSSYGQDSHCIPLAESAVIHQLAYRKLLQDTIISQLEGQIVILQAETASIRNSYAAELQAEKEKNELQIQNVEGFKSQILSYESENNYLKKREKKARRERNLAIGLGVILIALAVVK